MVRPDAKDTSDRLGKTHKAHPGRIARIDGHSRQKMEEPGSPNQLTLLGSALLDLALAALGGSFLRHVEDVDGIGYVC